MQNWNAVALSDETRSTPLAFRSGRHALFPPCRPECSVSEIEGPPSIVDDPLCRLERSRKTPLFSPVVLSDSRRTP